MISSLIARHRTLPLLITILLFAGTVQAQDAVRQATPDERPAVKKAEKIRVTGSRIKRTEVEGITPVEIISREDIEDSGLSTLAEIVAKRPVSTSGSYNTHLGGEENRSVTRLDLHGMGAENTLVLLDGRRLPDEGGSGIVDISTLPAAAIERIEILKDSASALYGSDATAGVVNIITRKDFSGTLASASVSAPARKGGQITDYTIVQGINTRRVTNLLVLNYQHGEPVWMHDRSWTDVRYEPWASAIGNAYHFENNIPAGLTNESYPYTESSCGAGVECLGNYNQGHMLTSEYDHFSVLNNFRFAINSDLAVFATVRGVRNDSLVIQSPAPNATWAEEQTSLTLLRPDNSFVTVVPSPASAVRYFATLEPWGPRTWETEKTALGGVLGLTGALPGDWEWTASASVTRRIRDLTNPAGFVDRGALDAALARGDYLPLQADPFPDADTRSRVIAETSVEPFQVTRGTHVNYEMLVTGDLFEMPGGMAGAAVGVSHSMQEFSVDYSEDWTIPYRDTLLSRPPAFQDVVNENDGNRPRGSSLVLQADGGGEREVTAVFAEFVAPVTAALEIQLAARHDSYSDFGSTTNPKAGFRYLVSPEFLLRGGAGTGFKAPTMARLYGGSETLWETVRYEGEDYRVPVTRIPSKDLKEETSQSWTVGFVTEPVSGFSLGADYWYIRIKDVIKELSGSDIIDRTDNPDLAGVTTEFDADGGLAGIGNVPYLNLGEKEDAGVDVTANARFRQGATRWTLSSAYSAKFYSREIAVPRAPQEDTLGEKGKPRWRAVNSARAGFLRVHTLGLKQNLIGRQESYNPQVQKYIDQSVTYDLSWAWNFQKSGTLSVTALNVLDTPFPRDLSNTARPIDGAVRVNSLYSPDDGIRYVVGLQQSF